MERIGRYQLNRVLGVGGSARVYEAVLERDDGTTLPVALKVLEEGAGEALREARIGGLLRHRHLVDVYEVGEDAGRWFCALELCEGSLAERLPLPPRAVVEVGLQVCAALGYAHEELGLVHLDLKPQNLLVADGVVKVGDLGIARAEGFSTRAGIRGTPGYMAPEQARNVAVDTRADIYALGVTLVELATGARPGASATLDLAWLDDEPAPDVPQWLEPVVERCLAEVPEDRWPDMAALADALRALPADGPGLGDLLASGPAAPVEDAFVGRGPEIAHLTDLLESCCVVTVKGPAGIGKSRLARRVAARWGTSFACDLGEARDAETVTRAVGHVLGAPADQLAHALAARGPILVVLDGVERVEGLAPLLSAWRARAPQARLLLTSRSVVPGVDTVVELGPLERDAAVALLVDRARWRGAEIRDDPRLLELASRLEGVPLALELAAGRLGVLSVGEVCDRLGLALLRRGTADRHGTLRAALDWSWEQLSDVQRAALTQLSVFAGGFTLEAAADVVDLGGASVAAAVSTLLERSMVAGGPRLRLLDSVREYAAEHLRDGGAAHARHGGTFARFGSDEAIEALQAHGGLERRRALVRELDNIAAACRRAIAREDPEIAVAALRAMWTAVDVVGPYSAVCALAHEVAALPGLTDREAGLTQGILGRALRMTGRMADAEVALNAAHRAFVRAADRRRIGHALADLGTLHRELGRLDQAAALYREALAGSDSPNARSVARVGLARILELEGRLAEARAHLDEALATARETGDLYLESVVLGQLGRVLVAADPALADPCLRTALAMHRDAGDRRSEGVALNNLCALHMDQQQWTDALGFVEAALTLHRELGNRRSEGVSLGNLGAILAQLGRPDEAVARTEEALAIARELDDRRTQAMWLYHLARWLEDEALLDESEALLIEVGDTGHLAWTALVRAELRIGAGDEEGARAALARAEASAPPMQAFTAHLEEVRARVT